MNNEEKKQRVEEACGLLREAAEQITKAKKLLKKCGIECCPHFEETIPADKYCSIGSNLQLSKGINKFADIIGAKPYFHKDIRDSRKTDKSRCYVKHKGLIFIQLGVEKTRNDIDIDFNFR